MLVIQRRPDHQPLSLDEPRLDEWYAAYTELAARLSRPDQAAAFCLATGAAHLTHAHRVSHARTAFSASGDRCIRDLYFEFDNVLAEIDRLTGDNPEDGDPGVSHPLRSVGAWSCWRVCTKR